MVNATRRAAVFRPHRDPATSGERAEAAPGAYRAFTDAVLRWHRVRAAIGGGVAQCSCGQSVITCPIQALARALSLGTEPIEVAG